MNVLLSMAVWAPAVAALVVAFMPERSADQRGRIRLVGLAGAGFPLFLILLALYARIGEGSSGGSLNGALVERHGWIEAFPITAGYHLDADGISLPLLLLATGLFVCAMFAAWRNHERVRHQTALLMLLQVGVTGVLSAQDYLLLILFWGMQILPLYLLIAGWGGPRRRRAAEGYLAVALTSLALLTVALGIIVAVAARAGHPTFDLGEVNGQRLETLAPGVVAAAFWLTLVALSLSLAVVPAHRWMINAGAEATPAVAALLCGVVVTLGGYGMVRILLGAFPEMAQRYSLLLAGLGAVSALWAAFAAHAQREVRRLVLHGSVAQAGIVLLAVGAQSSLALDGVVLTMVARGLAYGMLLLLCGAVEERGRTGRLDQLGGLAWQAPRLGWLWLFAGFAAMGAPLLAGFTAELMVFAGGFPAHRVVTVLVMAGVGITTGSLLLTAQRIFFGPAREAMSRVRDATPLEITYLTPLIAGLLFFGVLPRAVLPVISAGVSQLTGRLGGGR